jgi:hypothetical protein
MNTIRTMVGLTISMLALAGCAADTTTHETEQTATSEAEALTYADLYGTWIADTGPIYEITFDKDAAETLGGFLKGHHFSATVDNGIRCVTTPCPSSDQVGGVFKKASGTSTKVTLASYDKPSAVFAKYLGDYTAKVTSTKLTLKKQDGTIAGTFHRSTGTKCGTTICAAGTVCCNPLMNICTKPGMVCIQLAPANSQQATAYSPRRAVGARCTGGPPSTGWRSTLNRLAQNPPSDASPPASPRVAAGEMRRVFRARSAFVARRRSGSYVEHANQKAFARPRATSVACLVRPRVGRKPR